MRNKTVRGPDQRLTRIARRLRVDQTDAETVLWNRIRNRRIDGHKFVRQTPIANYICDFVCRAKLIVIEVDADSTASLRKTRYEIVVWPTKDTRYSGSGTTRCSATSTAS
jgi:very-short-patch-repair endonuclease